MWKLEEAWRPPYDANTTLPVYVEAVQYDRSRLGSTAEHLLRTVRCPAFIVGPNALLRDREAAPVKRILCPTSSLEIADSIFCFAGHFAGQMRVHLELAYVVDPTQKDVRPGQRCEEWTTELRERGVKVTWTVLYGRAGAMLAQSCPN